MSRLLPNLIDERELPDSTTFHSDADKTTAFANGEWVVLRVTPISFTMGTPLVIDITATPVPDDPPAPLLLTSGDSDLGNVCELHDGDRDRTGNMPEGFARIGGRR